MGTSDWADLRAVALDCAAEDPDPATRAELEAALRAGDRPAVERAFHPRLEFGTAGLRGEVGAGPARLNLLVCARFAWALGTFLKARPELCGRGVLVGFDARHDSLRFARMIEEVLTGLGLSCWRGEGPLPTPVVAFGVRHLRAAAGVVVTASHNPARDNGIKLYDADGMQIVAPWDQEIERSMRQAPRFPDMPRGAPSQRRLELEVLPAYLDQLRARVARWPTGPRLRVAYTPMHGVGLATLRAATAGADVEVCAVPAQAEPDGDFPTAPFPNPEEAGALDLLLELAREERVDLALANDPDADRLAVALPDGKGDFVKLTGDEVGLLLCEGLWDPASGPPVCVSSVVSSPMLDVWASQRGGRVERTLTGFKWLARAAQSVPRCVLAYEEALGYLTPAPSGHGAVLDKDGLAAALDLVGCARRVGGGAGLLEQLASLSQHIGVWVCHGTSIRLGRGSGSAAAAAVMTSLRTAPPRHLCGEPIVSSTDYLADDDARPSWLGRQDLLALGTEGGIHLFIRPSGTEPKVKLYLHLVGQASGATGHDYLERRSELLVRAAEITRTFCLERGLA